MLTVSIVFYVINFSFVDTENFLCFGGYFQKICVVFLFYHPCLVHTKRGICMWVICMLCLRAAPEFIETSEW